MNTLLQSMTIGAKLSTKFNDGHELRWNLPASIYEFQFTILDVVFVDKQLSLCRAQSYLDVHGFD